jgi:signal recognition particle subunit SRP54
MMRTMMRQFANMSMWERMKMLTGLSKAGAFMPGSNILQKTKIGTGHRKTAKERAEERKKKRKKGRR